ncbi:hypothetical protein BC332_32528 [Capsicum chinense]|nr:hypothetical protein BC332_32528 [Capsicum chinense]
MVFREEHCTDELKDVGEKIAKKCDGFPLVLDLIGGVISRKEKKEALWLEVLNNLSSFIFKDEEEVMKDVGEKIAKKCDGFPLVLDLIGGVISRKEKKEALWLEVLNNLSSFIFKDEEEVMKVIQLSYDHLSDILKLCLLYLASYPKDEDIAISSLKKLWTDEGLAEPTDLKSVEEVLEDYVDKLISSSLMQAAALPPSFSNLCNLETLVVYNSGSNLVLSPTIWSLAKLRYVEINTCSVFDSDIYKPTKLENLTTLKFLNLSCSVDSEDIFKRFPNLRTLGFVMYFSAAEQIYFPRLDLLNKLERIYAIFLCFGHTHVHQFDSHFPSSLKEVNLNGFNLTSDALSGIGRSLPNLQKLELHNASIQGGKELKMEQVTFHNLKSLKLDTRIILQMNPFPCSRN